MKTEQQQTDELKDGDILITDAAKSDIKGTSKLRFLSRIVNDIIIEEIISIAINSKNILGKDLIKSAASSSAEPPISPIMIIPSVSLSSRNISKQSIKLVPLTGSPPIPMHVV